MLICVLVLIVVVACSSIDCPIQNTVYTVYAIKGEAEVTDTLKDTLSILSIRKDGADTLLLYNRGTSLTTFSLPVSYDSPADTLFFLIWKDSYLSLDTVWIEKRNTPHFESVDCSATFFHDITAVRTTHHGIDTLIINNPTVNYESSTEHFHIRFKAHD